MSSNLPKKIICGNPTVKRQVLNDYIWDYYYVNVGSIGVIPVEAIETACVEFTGKWRIVGDVDNQRIEVEVDIDWKITPQKLKFHLGWPLFRFVKQEPDIHGVTVWIQENDFEWLTPYNENICGCAQKG